MAKTEKQAVERPRRRRPVSQVRSAEELAEVLEVGKNQVYEALAAGQIEGAFRFNRKWIIPAAVFERLLNGGVTGKINSTV